MGLEIERKFLVDADRWQKVVKPPGHFYRQGYIVTEPGKTIRVRLSETNAYLTIKGALKGAVRKEFEYPIPLNDAHELLNDFTNSSLVKTRYKINFKNKEWEVDEFAGENEGLIIAEIELHTEAEPFAIPDWIDTEVTADEKYYSASLSRNPYKNWPEL